MTICKKCGKEIKKGIWMHEMNCKGTNKNASGDNKPSNDAQTEHKPSNETHNVKIGEIDLNEEYEKNKDKIEKPKEEIKKEDAEAAFQCGGCGATFAKRHKFCPECGVSFE